LHNCFDAYVETVELTVGDAEILESLYGYIPCGVAVRQLYCQKVMKPILPDEPAHAQALLVSDLGSDILEPAR